MNKQGQMEKKLKLLLVVEMINPLK